MESTDYRIEIIASEGSTDEEFFCNRISRASKEEVELALIFSDFLFSHHFPLPSARALAKKELISAIEALNT